MPMFVMFLMCSFRIYSQNLKLIDEKIIESLNSDEVGFSQLKFMKCDTLLIRIYNCNPIDVFVKSETGGIEYFYFMDALLFNQDYLYLTLQEKVKSDCFTRSELDCVVGYLENGSIDISFVYRCNATIVRSIYREDRGQLLLLERSVAYY